LLNPFRVLFAERVVNLVLKLDVRANFARAARRHVHFHIDDIGDRHSGSHGASGGFCGTTYEVVPAPSFERDRGRKKLSARKRRNAVFLLVRGLLPAAFYFR
jgi:hypothetical protein